MLSPAGLFEFSFASAMVKAISNVVPVVECKAESKVLVSWLPSGLLEK
jgi:hypothetical protein